MDNTNLPRTWKDFLEGQKFAPAIVKSIERIHDNTWEMKPNIHDHFEMVYVKKGSVSYKINDAEIQLGQYDLILIKPRQTHVVTVLSKEACELFVLSFSLKSSGTNDENRLTEFMDFINTDTENNYIRLHLTRKNDFTAVFERIVKERRKGEMWDELMVNFQMMELFILLSRGMRAEWEQSVKNRSSKMKELLLVAKEYIDKNYNKNITLADVASYIFFSESYFAHSFKQEFGISPKSYLLHVRVQAAKEMLEISDMKIGDIAISVGFSGQQRFNDIFKKTEGITPMKYRRDIRMKELNVEK